MLPEDTVFLLIFDVQKPNWLHFYLCSLQECLAVLILPLLKLCVT